MKFSSFVAFSLTLSALILILVGFTWSAASRFVKKGFCDRFSFEIEPQRNEVQLDTCEGKLVKVTLKNNGLDDEYRASVGGVSWAKIKPETVEVGKGESENLFLYLSPPEGTEGKFDVKIFVSSYCFDKEKGITISV